jgi:hypothetical protein
MSLCKAGEGFHGLWVVRVLPTEALRFVRAGLREPHKGVVVPGKPCIASTDRFSCVTQTGIGRNGVAGKPAFAVEMGGIVRKVLG